MRAAKYIRWSTINQTGARQSFDKEKFDVVFQEQISGSIAFAKRPKGSQLLAMIQRKEITDLYTEDFTRLGRNAFDILATLNECEANEVTVHIQNMGLSSRVNGKYNPLFKMFSHIMSVISEQERENIKERTEAGKLAARQKGVQFGRKEGSNERVIDFIKKSKNQEILRHLKADKNSIRQIAKLTDSSTATVMKVKKLGSSFMTQQK